MSQDAERPTWPPISPVWAGLRGRCPRCGQGRLFDGFLAVATSCDVCGLDYGFADPADGPAFFVMSLGCLPPMGLALWLEVEYEAPFWVHLFTTLPLLLICCILPLRPLKGWLIDSQYYFKAAPGHIVPPPDAGS